MIELGAFSGGYHYRVSSPGHVNAKGQLDDFAIYCDTLMQARGVEAVRDHVAAKPTRQPSGKWKGPATPWLLGSTKYTVNPYRAEFVQHTGNAEPTGILARAIQRETEGGHMRLRRRTPQAQALHEKLAHAEWLQRWADAVADDAEAVFTKRLMLAIILLPILAIALWGLAWLMR